MIVKKGLAGLPGIVFPIIKASRSRAKRVFCGAALLLLVMLGLASQARALTGRVTWVYDGDTIKVGRGRGFVKVRVFGIDCPEKGQAYSREAREYVIDRVKNHIVRVEEKDRDKYGRVVGRVVLEDGTDLGRKMIEMGLAWHYRYFSNDPDLAALELKARRARRGLWRDPHPTPPWDYKKQGRTGR